ncbi:hypothetical protein TNCV_2800581 [Trichonephila clavipes]|nr:hypothetical protein TNCV_2800581 [Trichonephila clavipes]
MTLRWRHRCPSGVTVVPTASSILGKNGLEIYTSVQKKKQWFSCAFFCVSRLPMSRRKHRASFDQISEFDRGRIVAHRNCGLPQRNMPRCWRKLNNRDADLSLLDVGGKNGLIEQITLTSLHCFS